MIENKGNLNFNGRPLTPDASRRIKEAHNNAVGYAGTLAPSLATGVKVYAASGSDTDGPHCLLPQIHV